VEDARLLDVPEGPDARPLAGHGQAEGHGLAGQDGELLDRAAQRDGAADAPVVFVGVAVEALVLGFHRA